MRCSKNNSKKEVNIYLHSEIGKSSNNITIEFKELAKAKKKKNKQTKKNKLKASRRISYFITFQLIYDFPFYFPFHSRHI